MILDNMLEIYDIYDHWHIDSNTWFMLHEDILKSYPEKGRQKINSDDKKDFLTIFK